MDATIELLSDAPVLKSKSLVHFHLGTAETVARVILYGQNEVKAGEQCYCQFRLREPVIAVSGDRYIIRRFSPVETIGGGEVLDPLSFRKSKKESVEDLTTFEKGALAEKIAAKVKSSGVYGIRISLIEGWINAEIPSIKDSIRGLKERGIVVQFEDTLLHKSSFDTFKEAAKVVLSGFHKKNPLKPGMPKEELRAMLNLDPRLFGNLITAVKDIVIDKELARLSTFSVALSQVDETVKSKLIDSLEKGGFQPPSKEELAQALKLDSKRFDDILKLMTKEGSLVRISESMYVTSSVYEKMIEGLKTFYSKKSDMTVAEFRDVLNTSRKFALPFLEYLDSHKITVRVGDVRKFLLK